MDRRQKKTREAIFSSFSELLAGKHYENITVQDIIDKADVGRSTFYSHFETKDHLLREICADIFDHIINGAVCSYQGRGDDLEDVLTHILTHLLEKRRYVKGLLCSESCEIFMRYLYEYLTRLFTKYTNDLCLDVPREFLIDHLTGSFVHAIRWWIRDNMQTSPGSVAHYFMTVIEKHG